MTNIQISVILSIECGFRFSSFEIAVICILHWDLPGAFAGRRNITMTASIHFLKSIPNIIMGYVSALNGLWIFRYWENLMADWKAYRTCHRNISRGIRLWQTTCCYLHIICTSFLPKLWDALSWLSWSCVKFIMENIKAILLDSWKWYIKAWRWRDWEKLQYW